MPTIQPVTQPTTHTRPHIVGLGGTLHTPSTSLAALESALKAAERAGASTEVIDLNVLALPMFIPGLPLTDADPKVADFLERVRRADAMILSTAAYHGTLAGVTKNALDFLEYLARDATPYLHGKVVGLIATAGGDLAAVNAINAMVHVMHALRGTVAPLFVPIPKA